jgi:hypothetical protein
MARPGAGDLAQPPVGLHPGGLEPRRAQVDGEYGFFCAAFHRHGVEDRLKGV